MAVTLPPTPSKTPVTMASGHMHPIWIKWFEQVFLRIGGNIAPSNNEIVDDTSLTALSARIDSVETVNTTQSSDIDTTEAQINGLSQGPVL